MHYELVVHNGTILTVNPTFDIIDQGMICIREGVLERVESLPAGIELPKAKICLDARGGLIMPGLVNTHTHLPMSLFRGLADDLPLQKWLHDYIFPAETSFMDPRSVYWGALLSCAELLLSGTTTCCDGYFHAPQVAAAAREAGLRAIVGQGIVDFPAPGVPDPVHNLAVAEDFCNCWDDPDNLIVPSLFCHSPYTCSPGTLRQAKQAACERGLLWQIHVAETRQEHRQIMSEHGISPLKLLEELELLDAKTLLVHTIWVDRSDIECIARSAAGVSVTTESEMKLASGIAPLTELIATGVAVGLGTDGSASNNDLDLLREMDLTAKLHKSTTGNPTAMDARTVIRMATMGGASALGMGDRIGSLEIGKQADLIVIDTDQPHLTPMHRPESLIVYSASGADVRHTVVHGRLLVRDRQLQTLDWNHLRYHINALAGKIAANGARDYFPPDQGEPPCP